MEKVQYSERLVVGTICDNDVIEDKGEEDDNHTDQCHEQCLA